MAWSITSLANYSESDSGSGSTTSKTTGSVSIPANCVILVFAHGGQNSPAWYSSATLSISDSVNGTAWTGLDSLVVPSGANVFDEGGQLFYKSFTSSTTGTITMTVSTGDLWWGYSILAVTGQDTANPIIQAKGAGNQWSDGGNTHAQSVTLTSPPTSGNAVAWFLGVNTTGGVAATQPSGYTSISNPSASFEPTSAAYHTSTTTATMASTDVGNQVDAAIAFAVELKAASGGGGGSSAPISWLQF